MARKNLGPQAAGFHAGRIQRWPILPRITKFVRTMARQPGAESRGVLFGPFLGRVVRVGGSQSDRAASGCQGPNLLSLGRLRGQEGALAVLGCRGGSVASLWPTLFRSCSTQWYQPEQSGLSFVRDLGPCRLAVAAVSGGSMERSAGSTSPMPPRRIRSAWVVACLCPRTKSPPCRSSGFRGGVWLTRPRDDVGLR